MNILTTLHPPRRRTGITRRDELLELMAVYIQQYHNAPSSRELAALYHREYPERDEISHKTVCVHLDKLEEEGRITRQGGRLKIVGAEWEAPPDVALPVRLVLFKEVKR